mmetsp:Transcript_89778/g.253176  ORF Transcript_89778/g.253176 Transcript_89778/m.253176 type:complete len:265 (-) Transcript_89778:749-1543(-)
MFHSLDEIGYIPVHRALVLHCTRHALRHLDRSAAAEITVIRTFFHGVDGAHATVALQAHAAVRVEILPRRLLRAGEQAATHGDAGAHAQGLHNMPWARDAPVRKNRDAMRASKLGDVENRRSLRATASAYLLCSANGANAHAHSQRVHAAIDKVFGLPFRDHVPADDLQLFELLFHPPNNLMLEDAVTLATVDDNGVHASSNQSAHAVPVTLPCPDSGGHHKAAVFVLGRERELGVFFQVGPGDHRHEAALLRRDWKFPLLGFP